MNRIRVIIVFVLEVALAISTVIFLRTYKNTSLDDIKKGAHYSIEGYYSKDEKIIKKLQNDVHHAKKMFAFEMVMSDPLNDVQLTKDNLTEKDIEEHKKEFEKNEEYYSANPDEFENWPYSYDEYLILREVIKSYRKTIEAADAAKDLKSLEKNVNYLRNEKPREIRVGDRIFYIKLIRSYQGRDEISKDIYEGEELTDEFIMDFNSARGYEVIYINVTAQYKTVEEVLHTVKVSSVIIGIIGFICALVVSFLLEKNERMQKKFFENTSHELKTPLAAIKGYAEGIQKGVIDDTQKTGLIISKQTDKMTKLVEDILSVARLESGAIKLDKEVVDTSEFIQDCLMPYEGEVRERNLEIELDLDEADIKVDYAQFERAFANIINESLEKAKSRVLISNNENKIDIWTDCSDFSDEDIKHMFDRFYVKSDGKTGVELALARDIIAFHGYKIDAKRVDDGIDFVIDVRG